jgi:hypothetical protein
MHKFTALALTAALGVAAMGYTKSADAGVYVGVGLPVPVVAPPVVAYPAAVGVYAPYYYGRPYYYGPGFVGYGYGFRGYGYGFRGGVGFHGGLARGFRR